MDDETYESLERVISYYYAEERRNWEECGKPRKGHIFLDLRNLRGWTKTGAGEYES